MLSSTLLPIIEMGRTAFIPLSTICIVLLRSVLILLFVVADALFWLFIDAGSLPSQLCKALLLALV